MCAFDLRVVLIYFYSSGKTDAENEAARAVEYPVAFVDVEHSVNAIVAKMVV
jgi:hypothetical protein